MMPEEAENPRRPGPDKKHLGALEAASRRLTYAVIRDLDGAGGGPDAGVDQQAERHHPQGQDRGAGRHADTEEEEEEGRGRSNKLGDVERITTGSQRSDLILASVEVHSSTTSVSFCYKFGFRFLQELFLSDLT